MMPCPVFNDTGQADESLEPSSTAAQLEIRSPGAYATVQDRGRSGFRRFGVPVSGTLQPELLRIANALVGNPPFHPAIECFDGGQVFVAHHAPVRVAVAGWARLQIQRGEHKESIAAWQSHTLQPGDALRLTGFEHGRIALVSVEHLHVPTQLGSASTYARAALGGLNGQALTAGDRLSIQTVLSADKMVAPGAHAQTGDTGRTTRTGHSASCVSGNLKDRPSGQVRTEKRLPTPPGFFPQQAIRLIPGPQADHFCQQAVETLSSSVYRVDAASDRMGMRLQGPQLLHDPAQGSEIISDAIVAGAIQVPGDGKPIVLLADAQTVGGYPKIATVISPDLGRLSNRKTDDPIQFEWMDNLQANAATRLAEQALSALIASIIPVSTTEHSAIDLPALYSSNLISGMVNAKAP